MPDQLAAALAQAKPASAPKRPKAPRRTKAKRRVTVTAHGQKPSVPLPRPKRFPSLLSLEGAALVTIAGQVQAQLAQIAELAATWSTAGDAAQQRNSREAREALGVQMPAAYLPNARRIASALGVILAENPSEHVSPDGIAATTRYRPSVTEALSSLSAFAGRNARDLTRKRARSFAQTVYTEPRG